MWVAERLAADGSPHGLREIDWGDPPFPPVRSSRTRASRLLVRLAEELGVEVPRERLRHLGGGLSHQVYLAYLVSREKHEFPVVVRVPIPDPAARILQPDEIYRQALLLEAFSRHNVPFEVPRIYALIRLRHAWASVLSLVPGVDLCHVPARSLETVAEAAACVHRLDPMLYLDYLEPCESRRQFARKELKIIEETQIPGGRKALQWASHRLPPDQPCRLVHGDLLPQNLLVDLDFKLHGILDWEYSRLGDPAYDLAVVTRGVARPFKSKSGLQDLVEAYNQHSTQPIQIAEVQLYELCIRAHEYSFAVGERGRKSGYARQAADGFGSLLKRILG